MTTVAELIAQLKEVPEHYRVLSNDGMGLSGDAVVDYQDDEIECVWVVG
jgi:hypothetical protein